MISDEKLQAFQEARPQLVGVAYRLLGSISEAEDAVQDTCVKWFDQDGPWPDRPVAWMTTVCTNLYLDILRSSHRKRVDYVGPWLPDYLATETAPDAAQNLEMASSLTTAFMLMLERLTPRERAAYLLHDIFDMPFEEVATSLNLSEANCRQIASRARRMIGQENVRFVPEEAQQKRLLEGFQEALETGSAERLARLLSDDVDLRADSGGKVIAIRHILEGAEAVVPFIIGTLSAAWADTTMSIETVNGQMALILRSEGQPSAVVTFGYDTQHQISSVFILRNPHKLIAFSRAAAHLHANGGLEIN